ncbi:MAG: Glutamine--fructose-6-phosphate aminotransferase [isomerizing] [Holosporales bacterium]
MCGVVGILSLKDTVADRLVEGLKRLEYRGYDSSGIATFVDGEIERRRSVGKLVNLEHLLKTDPIDGFVGIAHTRWATHGKADETNAHPHSNKEVAVVHNGIIENFAELKVDLEKKGYVFESETDTEVIVHLLTDFLKQGLLPEVAFKKMLQQLHGAFALVVLLKNYPHHLFVARFGSPLVLGISDSDLFIGSDALALAPWTSTLCYLEEGDMAVLKRENDTLKYEFINKQGDSVTRALHQTRLNLEAVSKGAFNHYMLKEIHEQPKCLAETFQSFIDLNDLMPRESLTMIPVQNIKRIALIACGTSFYACQVAKYWFESIAKVSVDVDIASEFRYRSPVLDQYDLAIVVSQSGETIDTLWTVRQFKENNVKVIGIVNVEESSIDRESDFTLLTQAGPEIGVASTKAFTSQLLTFSILCLYTAFLKNSISKDAFKESLKSLMHLPGEILKTIKLDEYIQHISDKLIQASDVLYLGRGTNYPIAQEGALKLKELSYIHAEAYPAGELKHGPIALIDHKMPVIVMAPFDEWFLKTLSNVQEVLARGAYVIAITDSFGAQEFKKQALKNVDFIIVESEKDSLTAPILYTVPIQLLAYYTAYFKGTDVDKPRNLAKSVTVE